MEELKEKFKTILQDKELSTNCAELTKNIAIEYGCKVGFMMGHPEVCKENWIGLHNSDTAYETIYNNFEEFLKDSDYARL